MIAITGAEYQARVERLRQRLAGQGLDAALLTDEANIAYFAGYRPEHFFLTRSRMLALIVPARGPVVAVAPASHEQDVRDQTGLSEIVGYHDLRHAPVEEIGAVLDGLGARRVGLELGFEQRLNMTALDLERMRQRLRAEMVDVSGAIWALRTIKSEAELALIEHACRIGEAAWARSLATPRPGQTERAVAARLAAEIALLGGRVAFLIVTSGRDSFYRSNGAPRDRALERGDLVFVDIGVRYEGYHADFNRLCAVGAPTVEQRETQRRVREVSERAARYLVPGASAAEVYARVLADCMDAELAIAPPGRIGPGLGLGVTEPPHISREDDTVLAAGMVVTIEPALEREDGLYCAECIYVVTAGGGRRLNAGGADLEAVEDAAP